VVVATALLLFDSWRLLVLAGVVGLATFVVYALSRTIGIPGDSVDIGNWSEPLGMTSNFVEGIIAVYATVGIAVRRGNDPMRLALNWAMFKLWEKGRFSDLWLRYFPVSPF